MDKVKRKKMALLAIICLFILFSWGGCEEHRLGRGFTFFESPGMVCYWERGDTLNFNIPSKVLSYKNSYNYLLVKQHPGRYPHREDTPYIYPYGRDTVYYFFIDKKTKRVTGPMLYSEMEAYLQNIGIADMLHKLN